MRSYGTGSGRRGYRAMTFEQAWLNLGAEVLRLAIEDSRQTAEPTLRQEAIEWLCSAEGQLSIEVLMPYVSANVDVIQWAQAGCPMLSLHP